jgi:hypothetical protein
VAAHARRIILYEYDAGRRLADVVLGSRDTDFQRSNVRRRSTTFQVIDRPEHSKSQVSLSALAPLRILLDLSLGVGEQLAQRLRKNDAGARTFAESRESSQWCSSARGQEHTTPCLRAKGLKCLEAKSDLDVQDTTLDVLGRQHVALVACNLNTPCPQNNVQEGHVRDCSDNRGGHYGCVHGHSSCSVVQIVVSTCRNYDSFFTIVKIVHIVCVSIQKTSPYKRKFVVCPRIINALSIVRVYEQNEDRTSCVLFLVGHDGGIRLSSA